MNECGFLVFPYQEMNNSQYVNGLCIFSHLLLKKSKEHVVIEDSVLFIFSCSWCIGIKWISRYRLHLCQHWLIFKLITQTLFLLLLVIKTLFFFFISLQMIVGHQVEMNRWSFLACCIYSWLLLVIDLWKECMHICPHPSRWTFVYDTYIIMPI